jgi:hypothetical protein
MLNKKPDLTPSDVIHRMKTLYPDIVYRFGEHAVEFVFNRNKILEIKVLPTVDRLHIGFLEGNVYEIPWSRLEAWLEDMSGQWPQNRAWLFCMVNDRSQDPEPSAAELTREQYERWDQRRSQYD